MCAEQKQVAGIDRHPEMVGPAAERLDRGGDDVAPISYRRGAENHKDIAIGR